MEKSLIVRTVRFHLHVIVYFKRLNIRIRTYQFVCVKISFIRIGIFFLYNSMLVRNIKFHLNEIIYFIGLNIRIRTYKFVYVTFPFIRIDIFFAIRYGNSHKPIAILTINSQSYLSFNSFGKILHSQNYRISLSRNRIFYTMEYTNTYIPICLCFNSIYTNRYIFTIKYIPVGQK